MFWNRIFVSHWNPMVKEILLRSHTLPLDTISYDHLELFFELGQHANRVRMLRLLGSISYGFHYPPLSYFTTLFPSLTMLLLEDYCKTIDISTEIEPFPLFQALKINIEISHYQTTSLTLVLRNQWERPDVPADPTITYHHLEA
ncbi:hypothetical protein Clacol_000158 [Clathrus columnatus]|uniref:Uncharacterized protein n=1 Tax=Clathrus columnatus TaxID=1419009 RepID=A0AAV4ZW96_9AGAM|nr:hypothetical protein Clacol_000158 [Clathrus columnatus]